MVMLNLLLLSCFLIWSAVTAAHTMEIMCSMITWQCILTISIFQVLYLYNFCQT